MTADSKQKHKTEETIMKRTNLALVLTVILLTGALSGCGSKAVSSDAGQQTAAASS